MIGRREFTLGTTASAFAARSNLDTVKALTFDVFGTVVDWRSSVIREGEQLGKTKSVY